MNAVERALGILLMLTGGRVVGATDLAARFEVSVRTVYRDVDRLLALGVPVESVRGAEGGYRLPAGYVQPAVALNRSETASLLVALALVRGLKATPLAAHLDTAERKLLASLPQAARTLLADGSRLVGVEAPPPDIFHRERVPSVAGDSQRAVDGFMDGLLAGRRVRFTHANPYRHTARAYEVEPQGILFDRDHWYLAGRLVDLDDDRLWRADRVTDMVVTGMAFRPDPAFTVQSLLGRSWLNRAMRRWETEGAPARIRLTAAAAETLRRDWYYHHAAFQADGDRVIMTIPDTEPDILFPLIRWLGPDAELLEPDGLRPDLAADLAAMAARHRWTGG